MVVKPLNIYMQSNESIHKHYCLQIYYLKWILHWNVKYNIIKTLEGKIGGNLYELGFGDEFLNTTPIMQSLKEKKRKKKKMWSDIIKIKIFCSLGDTVKRTQRQAIDWGKYI